MTDRPDPRPDLSDGQLIDQARAVSRRLRRYVDLADLDQRPGGAGLTGETPILIRDADEIERLAKLLELGGEDRDEHRAELVTVEQRALGAIEQLEALREREGGQM